MSDQKLRTSDMFGPQWCREVPWWVQPWNRVGAVADHQQRALIEKRRGVNGHDAEITADDFEAWTCVEESHE